MANEPTPYPTGRLLTTGQAATLLGVSTETVRRWIEDGTLPAIRPNPVGRFRVWESEVQKRLAAIAAAP